MNFANYGELVGGATFVTDRKSLILYRLVLLCGWIPTTLGHLRRSPEFLVENPVLGPLLVTYLVLGAGSCLLSFVVPHVARYLGGYVLAGCFALAGYQAAAMYATSLATQEAVATLVTLGLLCFVFHRVAMVAAWAVIASSITILVALNIADPSGPIDQFVLKLVVIVFIPACISISQLRNKLALKKSSAALGAIFAQSADALFYGPPGKPNETLVSQRAKELFELEEATDLGVLVQSIFLRTYGDRCEEQLQKAFYSDYWSDNLEFVSASGRCFYGNMAVTKLDDVNENSVVVRVSDLSEMRDKQQELEAARDVAEAAIEIRSRFLANMSHEIRTPMNGVIGMTSLLMNTQLKEEQVGYIETIRSCGESLLNVINGILDFSKIEAGQVELESQTFDLEHCVADALDIVAPAGMQKGLEVILDMRPEDLVEVEGDVQRLKQILVNLLSNAIKFTEKGEVRLVVRLEKAGQNPSPSDHGDCRLRFDIVDTGIGIPRSKVESLFDAFTQADLSTTRRFGGTGLGLSISRSLTRLMGGDIEVTSLAGQGSSFSFWIDSVWKDLDAKSNLPKLKEKTVFAVDDNASSREVLQSLLACTGVCARLFSTPKELLFALEGQSPDLLIIDMAMPDTDGVQLMKHLQNKLAAMPPVVLLAGVDQRTKDWSVFTGVLRKPIRPSELVNGVANAIGGKRIKINRSGSAQLRPFDIGNQSILVAEDNTVNQTVARRILKKLGLNADVAANGLEALDMISRRSYSLVFMDVQMPELDGIAATQRIRARSMLLQPQIVAMTANATLEDKDACLSAGMDDFVAKPIRIEDVRDALLRAQARGAFDEQAISPSLAIPLSDTGHLIATDS